MNAAIESKSEAADNIILKYSLYASSSSLIPGLLFDDLADTAIQYKMIEELKKIYGIKTSMDFGNFVSIVVDNLAWKVVGDQILKILNGFSLATANVLGSLIQMAWDFITTMVIGFVFKKLYEHPELFGKDGNINYTILFQECLPQAIQYFKDNILTILGLGKITLVKYEKEIVGIVEEVKNVNTAYDQNVEMWKQKIRNTMDDLIKLRGTTEDFKRGIQILLKELGSPSKALIHAELEIRKAKGEKVDDLLLYVENI